MFKVSLDQQFYSTIDPNDPLNSLPTATIAAASRALSIQIDNFIRAALKKAYSDETVELFASDCKALPGVDLVVQLLTYRKQSVSVLFRGRELGRATFETTLIEMFGKYMITHEVSDVLL